MDSRPLLKNAEKIGVLIDSKTFEDLLKKGDRIAFAILTYSSNKFLDFVRSPMTTKSDDLNKVIEYQLERDRSEISSIKTYGDSSYNFGYKIKDILQVAKEVYKKDFVNQEELDKVTNVFIQAVLNSENERHNRLNIYVTNDEFLLKNRIWFEKHKIFGIDYHFLRCPINIMSVEEASLFLDLFFKKKELYFINGVLWDKNMWYGSSMRLKLAHLNELEYPMLSALARRFYYALMALDEIGIQYFLGHGKENENDMLYHFNYLIILITGIFDNLALKTSHHLKINFKDKQKISLNNASGKDFLKEIRDKHLDLRNHINDYVRFIKLIYSFRELVVHRKGLYSTRFNYGEGQASFIRVEDDHIEENLIGCGDKPSDYDPFTQWGFYKAYNSKWIGPHQFSLEVLKKLIKFIEKYLELLGYDSFAEVAKQKDDYGILNSFEQYHLGF